MEKTEVGIQIFQVIEPNEQKFVQIKLSHFRGIDKVERKMLQIIDITGNILYQQQKSQNELLAMINVCVSHELRNPLNSISALNVEKKHIYKLIDQYIENEDFTKEMLIKNLKLAMK